MRLPSFTKQTSDTAHRGLAHLLQLKANTVRLYRASWGSKARSAVYGLGIRVSRFGFGLQASSLNAEP